MPTSLKIAQQGDPVLQNLARPVDDISAPHIQQLIDDMLLTITESKGVGLAAPQVHQPIRLIIIASHPNARYPDAPLMSPTAMINPEIISRSESTEAGWEGCLSIPGIRGQVPRATSLLLRYTNRDGLVIEDKYTSFPARIIQHEIDHLNGISFLERVVDISKIATDEEYARMKTPV